VAAAIGAWVLYRHRDAAYAAVLVWAFTGIAVKEWDAVLLSTGAIAAGGILALIVLGILVARSDGSGGEGLAGAA
jgi:hypothetical protein